MENLADMADDLLFRLIEVEDIINTLRDAIQYQAESNGDSNTNNLAVANIICEKMKNVMIDFDDFIYKIPSSYNKNNAIKPAVTNAGPNGK